MSEIKIPKGVRIYTSEDLKAFGVFRLQTRARRGLSGFPFSENIADEIIGLRAQNLDLDQIVKVMTDFHVGLNLTPHDVQFVCVSRKRFLRRVSQILGLSPPDPIKRNSGGGSKFTDDLARKAMAGEKRKSMVPISVTFKDVLAWLHHYGWRISRLKPGLYRVISGRGGREKIIALGVTAAQIVKLANNLRVRLGGKLFCVKIDVTAMTAERDACSYTATTLGQFKTRNILS